MKPNTFEDTTYNLLTKEKRQRSCRTPVRFGTYHYRRYSSISEYIFMQRPSVHNLPGVQPRLHLLQGIPFYYKTSSTKIFKIQKLFTRVNRFKNSTQWEGWKKSIFGSKAGTVTVVSKIQHILQPTEMTVETRRKKGPKQGDESLKL